MKTIRARVSFDVDYILTDEEYEDQRRDAQANCYSVIQQLKKNLLSYLEMQSEYGQMGAGVPGASLEAVRFENARVISTLRFVPSKEDYY